MSLGDMLVIIMKDTKYQNMPKNYKCENCGSNVDAPMHCGHAMHIEDLDDGKHWVCWMGTGCGKKEYTACCDSPSLAAL